ncbi:MAG: hypothetical protein ABSG22_05520 [Sedimentisphaerales bacterium]
MNFLRDNYKGLVAVILLVFLNYLLYEILQEMRNAPHYQLSNSYVLDTRTGDLWLRSPGHSIWCGSNEEPQREEYYKHYDNYSKVVPGTKVVSPSPWTKNDTVVKPAPWEANDSVVVSSDTLEQQLKKQLEQEANETEPNLDKRIGQAIEKMQEEEKSKQ